MKQPKIVKILYFPGMLTSGGVETVIMNIYRNIDKEKFHLDFCVPRDFEGQYDKEITKNGSRVISIPQIRQVGLFKYIKCVRNIIVANGPYDAVHVHAIHSGVFTICAALFAGVKRRIYHVHGTDDISLKNMPLSVVYRFIIRFLIKIFCTDFLACGRQAAEYIYGKRYVVKGKAQIINNALDLERFNAKSTDLLKGVKEQYHTDIVIGYAARFVYGKNHHFLIKTLYEYNKFNNAVLLLAGDGEARESCESYAKDIGIEKSVFFLGNVKDMPKFYNELDIFAFPSLFEGLPVSVLEAQACGVPCIMSDTITKECDMGLGLVFNISLQSGTDEWVKTIYELKDRKESDNRKIREAYMKRGYDINSMINMLTNIYENVK